MKEQQQQQQQSSAQSSAAPAPRGTYAHMQDTVQAYSDRLRQLDAAAGALLDANRQQAAAVAVAMAQLHKRAQRVQAYSDGLQALAAVRHCDALSQLHTAASVSMLCTLQDAALALESCIEHNRQDVKDMRNSAAAALCDELLEAMAAVGCTEQAVTLQQWADARDTGRAAIGRKAAELLQGKSTETLFMFSLSHSAAAQALKDGMDTLLQLERSARATLQDAEQNGSGAE